jgi:hypothetical protein
MKDQENAATLESLLAAIVEKALNKHLQTKCHACDGRGRRLVEQPYRYPLYGEFVAPEFTPCGACEGTGETLLSRVQKGVEESRASVQSLRATLEHSLVHAAADSTEEPSAEPSAFALHGSRLVHVPTGREWDVMRMADAGKEQEGRLVMYFVHAKDEAERMGAEPLFTIHFNFSNKAIDNDTLAQALGTLALSLEEKG